MCSTMISTVVLTLVISICLVENASVKMSFSIYEDPATCINQCRNGICIKSSKEDNQEWHCNCMNGYFGADCQEHPCDQMPCKNGGRCVAAPVDGRYLTRESLLRMRRMPSLIYQMVASKYTPNTVLGYQCMCGENFVGEHCESKARCKDHCDENADGVQCFHLGSEGNDVDVVTCSGVGKCMQDGDNVRCDCETGHIGKRCRSYAACHPSACHNGFACLPLYGAISKFASNRTCACEGNDNCAEYDINECEISNDCHQYATCSNQIGSYSCACNEGFEGDGKNCVDINECERFKCSENSRCVNTIGSFQCECSDGYEGDGITCVDKNECENGESQCDRNAACANTEGSYTCTCNVGYEGDGFSCADKNECENGESQCDGNAACQNTDGSYTCSCNVGYQGDGFNCQDKNECENGESMCDVNAACENTDGSYSCTCSVGYQGDGFNCTDKNECENGESQCDDNAACANTEGSYTCTCNAGYQGDGFSCADKNECENGENQCDDNAACANTEGSYTCTCNVGYQGDGFNCQDKNECENGESMCDVNAACENTEGSYTCTCNVGYEGDGFNCTDKNECENGESQCDDNAACANTEGSYTCTCNVGYQGDGFSCSDKNECENGESQCDENSACANTDGSYTCSCNVGFQGDGFSCADKNECENGESQCDENADCFNTVGSYACKCKSGYQGDGRSCADVNECESDDLNNCHEKATCVNAIGSYECVCSTGYEGNGVECADINECARGLDNCAQTNSKCINTEGSFNCERQAQADYNYYIRYNAQSETSDTPIISNVRNNLSPGMTMCTFYKFSKYPNRFPRSLFHYIIDQRLEGFQVFMHSQPEKLRVTIISESFDVQYPTNGNLKWNHLCVVYNLGKVTFWKDGNKIKTHTIKSLKGTEFPASFNSHLILGQDSDDFAIPFGVRDSYRAFQGSLTHFFLWEKALNKEEIRNAYRRVPTTDKAVVTWDQWRSKARGRTIRARNFGRRG